MNASICEVIVMILEYLRRENLTGAAHALEREAGIYFDREYFGELVMNGNWEEGEKYLSGFTGVRDNEHSRNMFYNILLQKFSENEKRDNEDGYDPANNRKVVLDYLQREIDLNSKLNGKLDFPNENNLMPLDLVLGNYQAEELLEENVPSNNKLKIIDKAGPSDIKE